MAFSGDPEIASDSVAEAFAQALGRGDALVDPLAWIWRVAFRVAAGELNERRRVDHRMPELSDPNRSERAASERAGGPSAPTPAAPAGRDRSALLRRSTGEGCRSSPGGEPDDRAGPPPSRAAPSQATAARQRWMT